MNYSTNQTGSSQLSGAVPGRKSDLTTQGTALEQALGLSLTTKEVSDLIQSALDLGVVSEVNKVAIAELSHDLEGGAVPPADGYSELLTAISDQTSHMALETLAQLFEPDDIIELRALDPLGRQGNDTNPSFNGRLSDPAQREQLAAFVQEHNGKKNVYFGINSRTGPMAGSNKPAKAANVFARRNLVLDLDNKSAPSMDPNWTQTRAALQDLSPKMVVSSGNGWHYWFSIEPVIGSAIHGVIPQMKAAMSAIGSDDMSDAPRIIRMPFTINVPTKRKRENGSTVALATLETLNKEILPRAVAELCDLLVELAASLTLPGSARPKTPGGQSLLPATPGEKTGHPAPSLEHVRLALAHAPNHPGGPFDNRHDWLAFGHAIKGAAIQAGIEPEARELFLDWCAEYGGDATADADFWDTCRNPHTGWGTVMKTLQRVNPAGYQIVEEAVRRQAMSAMVSAPIDPAQLALVQRPTNGPIERGINWWMRKLNAQYAHVLSLDRVVELDAEGAISERLPLSAFKAYYDGKVKFETDKSHVGLGTFWLNSPWARRFEKVGMWDVGHEPEGALNLWRGLPNATSFEPVNLPGAVVDPLNPILEFIRKVISSDRAAVADYVLNWLAYKVQNPLRAPGTVLALVGKQGTGKSTLARFMEDIVGPRRTVSASQERQMTGNFNAHFEDKLLAVFEEAFLGKDPKIAGPFKDLVTGAWLHIEAKGRDVRDVENKLAIILTSNNTSVVPLEPGDRRTTLIRVSDARRADNNYFSWLNAIWVNGGREAFIDFLLKRDVSQFDPRVALGTPEKALALMETGDIVTRYWANVLEAGHAPGGGMNAPAQDWTQGAVFVTNADLYADFLRFARDGGFTRYLPEKIEVVRRVGELCADMKPHRPRVDGKPGPRGYLLPPLSECTAAFESAVGVLRSGSKADPTGNSSSLFDKEV